jgi:hypothetical protein
MQTSTKLSKSFAPLKIMALMGEGGTSILVAKSKDNLRPLSSRKAKTTFSPTPPEGCGGHPHPFIFSLGGTDITQKQFSPAVQKCKHQCIMLFLDHEKIHVSSYSYSSGDKTD